MFTGIVEDIGTVKSVEKRGAFGRINIEARLGLDGVRTGDSISVNGACLTVTAIRGSAFDADISDESLRVTTLGELGAGDRVNIERALTLSKPLGGHLVTGHVDAIGTVQRMTNKGDTVDVTISVPSELTAQIVKKGSVAVDGISLTVADAGPYGFKVVIIPHTLVNTTVPLMKEGSRVNVETDIIGKYVERFFHAGRTAVTEDFLSEHGFLKKK